MQTKTLSFLPISQARWKPSGRGNVLLTATSINHGVDGRAVIRLAGEQDCANVDDLRHAIDRLAPGAVVELNLEEVEFIDSTVMHQVLRLHTKCTDEGGRLLVVAPERSIAYRVRTHRNTGGAQGRDFSLTAEP